MAVAFGLRGANWDVPSVSAGCTSYSVSARYCAAARMPLAVLFCFAVVSAGFVTLRALGLAKLPLGPGLAPPAGLAVLGILSSWCVLIGVPPPVASIGVLLGTLGGVGLLIVELRSHRRAACALGRDQWLTLATLVAAVAIPFLVMGLAFGGVQVPLSPHDGASHTEAIQANRAGQLWMTWYPPGTSALFAAFLELFPWIDSAQGAVDLGMSLPSLAALSVFGLGSAVWRDARMGATSALLLSFTYTFPFFAEFWSGWPLTISLVLVIGVWTLCLGYLRQPATRRVALAGLVLGEIVLVHGTELYTLALVLPILLVGSLRRVVWRRLPRDLGLAAGIGLVCAAAYLPTLMHWAGAGGAYAVGLEDGQTAQASVSVSVTGSPGPDPFVVFGLGALGIDLPVRVLLLAIGVGWALRLVRGRAVIAIGLVFVAVATIFSWFSGVSEVHQLYAATFPWGMHYRIFMVVAITQVLLAGAGLVVALRWVDDRASRPSRWAPRGRRLVRLLALAWLVLLVWGMVVFLAYPASLVLGYGDDDAAAMSWLRARASAADVIANDGSADAGIWIPYKAGLPILLPRSGGILDMPSRMLILDNVGRLEQAPDAAAAACALNVRWVYRGARASEWDARRFPPLAELHSSPALQEVFSSGEAVVFRVRLPCSSD